ncbi:glycosyltransferase [Cupriavidus sp. AU9028]|nr:glycosyltransferase [Cupriavidus sp. AU9028]MBY4898130.1 glycosyltransferase [Cupriavidus sp. AU9028]
MRILLLATGLRLGGAERQVMALAQRYAELGHAVRVVSLTDGVEVAPGAGVELASLAMRKTPWSFAAALWRLRRLVRAWRPDVVHSHMIHANLLARALASVGGMPLPICTAHSYREGGAASMLAYRLSDRWSRLTTHVGAEGRDRMVALRAAPADRIVVVPNGIDTMRFQPDPAARRAARQALGLADGERLVMHVGRLVAEKAQARLIDAFALACPGDGMRLLIAGGGPLRDALQRRIDAAGLRERALLLGPRGDIPALLNAADLFVLSSDIEGMPLVIGEALACGCPVVSTDAAGVAAIAGAHARIVPRGDTAALAAAIAQMLPAGRGDEAAQAARHRHVATTLGLDGIAGQWLALYRQYALGAGEAGVEPA